MSFFSFQSAEKSLKAVWFYKDANNCLTHSHDLCSLAGSLSTALSSSTSRLHSLLGNHTRMRYPDMYQVPYIPADKFDKNQAENSIKFASEIYEHVESILSGASKI